MALLILLLPNHAGEQSNAESQPCYINLHGLDVTSFFFFTPQNPSDPWVE